MTTKPAPSRRDLKLIGEIADRAVAFYQKHGMLLDKLQIVSMRAPRSSDHFARGTRCLLNMADGKIIAVQEECPAIRGVLE